MVEFSVVIATCGRPGRLRVCLERLAAPIAAAGGTHTVVVVDNHPERLGEPVVQEARERFDYAIAYLTSKPFSKSAALNVGIAAATTEWLAFTDDDTEPDEGWLREAVRYVESSNARVFAGRLLPGNRPADTPQWLTPGRSGLLPDAGVYVHYEPAKETCILPRDAPVPFGANVFVRRDIFADHGGYDEELWDLCGKAALGVDDGEFGIRIQKAGEPIGYCREALVVHPVHADRFSLKSQFVIGYRYGWRDPLVYVAEEQAMRHDWFRLRLIAKDACRGLGWLLRGDPAGALHYGVEVARNVGRMAGRRSHAFKRRI